jgi:hypothetical protein
VVMSVSALVTAPKTWRPPSTVSTLPTRTSKWRSPSSQLRIKVESNVTVIAAVAAGGHCHVNFCQMMRSRKETYYGGYANVLGASLQPPDLEGRGAGLPVGVGGHQVTAGMKVTINEAVGGKENLSLTR